MPNGASARLAPATARFLARLRAECLAARAESLAAQEHNHRLRYDEDGGRLFLDGPRYDVAEGEPSTRSAAVAHETLRAYSAAAARLERAQQRLNAGRVFMPVADLYVADRRAA